jgi:hypothetical protein
MSPRRLLVLVLASLPLLASGCGEESTGPSDGPAYACDGSPAACLKLGAGWTFEGTAVPNARFVNVSPILLPDGRVRLYGFDGNRLALVSYVSNDGRGFTQDPGDRMVLNDSHYPTVVAVPAGGFRMYYAHQALAQNAPGYRYLSSAWSDDGLVFTPESGARMTYLGTGHEADGLSRPRVVALPSGGLRMYYHGFAQDKDYLLSATSQDGLVWTREAGIRLDPSSLCPPEWGLHNVSPVYGADGRLHLFLPATSCTGQYANVRSGIWDATSTDGLSFSFPSSPMIQGYFKKAQYTGKATDPAVAPQDPAAILAPGGFRVYFGLYWGSQIIQESGIYSAQGL